MTAATELEGGGGGRAGELRLRPRGGLRRGAGCLLTVVLAADLFAAGEWPQFRGPAGDGHHGQSLPLRWSATEHIRWRTAIPGKAWASPVIWGSQIWLANASADGRELSVVCVDRETGRVVQDRKLFEVEKPQFCHPFNSYASPTPVLEAGRLYVTWGSPATACVDTSTGQVLWERRDLVCNHFRGAGASPILHGDMLILAFDGSDRQFVAALDKRSGRTVWQTARSIDFQDLDERGEPQDDGDLRKAFATPHVAVFDGLPLLLSSGAKAHYAYDPLTGRELWRVEDRTAHSASTRPVVGHGLVFVPAGWANGQLLAIRPGQTGEVADANAEPDEARQLRVVWKVRRSVARKPSVLLVGDLLFMIEDGGVATCLEAKTGVEIWRERVGGNYSASPLSAAGRIYFCSEEGKTTVAEASRQFRVLAENTLPDGFMASPAAAGNALFLRTRTHLYRVEDAGKAER